MLSVPHSIRVRIKHRRGAWPRYVIMYVHRAAASAVQMQITGRERNQGQLPYSSVGPVCGRRAVYPLGHTTHHTARANLEHHTIVSTNVCAKKKILFPSSWKLKFVFVIVCAWSGQRHCFGNCSDLAQFCNTGSQSPQPHLSKALNMPS